MQSANTVKFMFRKHCHQLWGEITNAHTPLQAFKKSTTSVNDNEKLRVGTFSKAILLHCKVTMQADKCDSLWLIFGRLEFRLGHQPSWYFSWFSHFLRQNLGTVSQNQATPASSNILPNLLFTYHPNIRQMAASVTLQCWIRWAVRTPSTSHVTEPGALYERLFYMTPASVHQTVAVCIFGY
jgi:hypothetical protein